MAERVAGILVMEKITSLSNEKVKNIVKLHQKKYRDENALFIAEGFKSVNEAISSGFEIQTVFLNEKFENSFNFDNVILASSDVMSKISTTDSDAPVVAVVKQKKYDISMFKKYKKLVLLDNIKDVGNLGTIIRSALAFDFEGILLTENSVDIYNPKVIRASVGTFFKMPFIYVSEDFQVKNIFNNHKLLVTVVDGEKSENLKILKNEKIICAFGSEADGISDTFIKQADYKVTISMQNDVESLNLSACASIVLYELS